MAASTVSDPLSLIGYPVYDTDGTELGRVGGVYLDRGTGEPEWAALRLHDGGITVVPLGDADLYEDSLALPFTEEQLRDAPYQRDELARELSAEEEAELYSYYHEGGAGAAARQAAAGVASTARAKGRRAASAAAGQGREVASATREQAERVASTVKGQGRQVAQSAAGQAVEVVGTAKEQAAQVAQQASAQARGLLEQTRNRVDQQAATGAEKLADSLRRMGEEAVALAEGRQQEAAMLGDYLQRAGDMLLEAADRVYGVAEDVQSRGVAGVLDDVQRFARRRPGVFLLGTALAGVAAGRVVRSASGRTGDAEPGNETYEDYEGYEENFEEEEAVAPPARAARSGATRRTRTTGGR